jgi:hypothetical protein
MESFDGQTQAYFEQEENFEISINHTHGSLVSRYRLPPYREWDREAYFDKWYFVTPKKVSRLSRLLKREEGN